MKRIILVLLCLWSLVFSPLRAGWEDDYASLLKKYATPAGVGYARWKANADDLGKLEGIAAAIQKRELAGKNSPEEKAFLINAYNIWVLTGVLQAFPIQSVKDIAPDFGFFSQDRIVLASQKTSLNTLEKKMLLQTYKDPRIHFAVNCASRSCPPLLAEPYQAGKLEAQLDGATRTFLQDNPEALQIAADRGSWKVSSLFDWYAGDFAAAGGAVAFIRKYRTDAVPETVKPAFLPYDWSLNEVR
jgi:hypothetical protein